MLKNPTLLYILVLSLPYNVMYGIRGKLSCTQIIRYQIEGFLKKFVELAKATQPMNFNEYTEKVEYFHNSKETIIYLKDGNQLFFPLGPDASKIYFLKGAPNNFHEVLDGKDGQDHPLYHFLRDNGILDPKNAPYSLPKTIM